MQKGKRVMLDASEYSAIFRSIPNGRVKISTVSMRDLFYRLGFDWAKGVWSREAWLNGWAHESDVLSEEELQDVRAEWDQ